MITRRSWRLCSPLALAALGLACGGLPARSPPPAAPEEDQDEPPPHADPGDDGPGLPAPTQGVLGRVAVLEEEAGSCRLVVYAVGVGPQGTERKVEQVVAATGAPCAGGSWWSADDGLSRGWIWADTDLDGAWRFEGGQVRRIPWSGSAGCRHQFYAHASDGTPLLFSSYCPAFADFGVHPHPEVPEGESEIETGAAVVFSLRSDHWVAGTARGVEYGAVESTDACDLPEAKHLEGRMAWPGCTGGWVGAGSPPSKVPDPPAFDWLPRCGGHVAWTYQALPGGTLAMLSSEGEPLAVAAFQVPGGPWKELDRCAAANNPVGGIAWSGGPDLVVRAGPRGGKVWRVGGELVQPLWSPDRAQAAVWLGPPR